MVLVSFVKLLRVAYTLFRCLLLEMHLLHLIFLFLTKILLKSLHIELQTFIHYLFVRTRRIMFTWRQLSLRIILPRHSTGLFVSVIHSFKLLICEFSANFLLGQALPQYWSNDFSISTFQFFLRPDPILHSFALFGVSMRTFDINSVKIPMKVYVVCYSVLVWIFFRVSEQVFLSDGCLFGDFCEMFLGTGFKVIDTLRDLGNKLWLFSVFEGRSWDIALVDERIGSIELRLIVIDCLFLDNY